MSGNAMKSKNMAKKKTATEKPLRFREAIELALSTPHLTHKQIDELRKKNKLSKKRKK